jgi:DNA-directed RNA polymerase subunit RPC12/RpoP
MVSPIVKKRIFPSSCALHFKQAPDTLFVEEASMTEKKDLEYTKIQIDNAVCKRRFHLIFNPKLPTQEKSVVQCPHCGIKIIERQKHPPITLAREENLVKTPDGSSPILYECQFRME